MERKYNMVGWFEIPATDMDRAIKFYEEVFQVKLTRAPMGDLEMAFFLSIINHLMMECLSISCLKISPQNYQELKRQEVRSFSQRPL
jgi:hypothetical protein